jgi:hypothetical protein
LQARMTIMKGHRWLAMKYDDGFVAYLFDGSFSYDGGESFIPVTNVIVQYRESDLVWFSLPVASSCQEV